MGVSESHFIQQVAGAGEWRIAAQHHGVERTDKRKRGRPAEKELVRCRAKNESSTPLVDQGHGFGGAGKTMDKHRALVEGMHAIEGEDFLRAFFIYPFRNMQNERQIGMAFRKFVRQLWLKG